MSAHGSLILSRGKSKVILNFALIVNAFRLFLLSFTWNWGIEGIIWGEIVHSILSYLVYMFWASKNINYKFQEQLSDSMPYLIAASLMGTATFFAGTLLVNASPLTLLSVQITVGAASYLIICSIFNPIAYKNIANYMADLRSSIHQP